MRGSTVLAMLSDRLLHHGGEVKKIIVGLLLALAMGIGWGLDELSVQEGLCVGIVIVESYILYECFCGLWVPEVWEYKARAVGDSEPVIHTVSDNYIQINKWRTRDMAQHPELIFTPIRRVRSNDTA